MPHVFPVYVHHSNNKGKVMTCVPLVNTNYFFLLLTLHLFFQDVVVNRRIRVKLLEAAEMVFKNMKCRMERE